MARVPFQVGHRRARKLLCPRCGEGRLFSGPIRMNETCSGCGMKFEREPGYFLGSSYINYGWTAVSITVAYLVLHTFIGYPNKYVLPPLITYCVVFPLFFHRYARAFWLAMDCYFDHTDLDEMLPPPPQAPPAEPDETESD